MKKTAFQVIEKAIKNRDMIITQVLSNTSDYISITAVDETTGLSINVECSIVTNGSTCLSIDDANNEDNFAITYANEGNMRSLSACMRIGMDNIIENA